MTAAAMTLITDGSAKPVGLVPVRAAVARIALAAAGLEAHGAQVLVADERRRFRSEHLDMPAPVVVLEPGYVELSQRDVASVTRRVLLARDRYQCQYCSFTADSLQARRQLTMDHVKPARLYRRREDATTWENVVAACWECNQAKGGRLPMEAGMMPRRTPREPHFVQVRFAGRLNPAQRDYVADYFRIGKDDLAL